jgi:hypothetical protein
MRITTRDWLATSLVGIAVIIAFGWFAPFAAVRSLDIRSIAIGVLVLGMLASAAAVVPGFAELIRGSRSYLLIASTLGLAALIAAGLTLVNRTEETLVALVGLTIALWAGATLRHAGAFGEHGWRPSR